MYKYLCLLLLLPLGLISTSCGDDDKVPDVDIQAEVSNAVVADNTVYIVQGEPLTVDGISLINHSGKEAALGVVTYYLDGLSIGTAVVSPYGFTLETDNLPVGTHTLTAEMPIYVVDYPICAGVFNFTVEVVADASDLPGQPVTSDIYGLVRPK